LLGYQQTILISGECREARPVACGKHERPGPLQRSQRPIHLLIIRWSAYQERPRELCVCQRVASSACTDCPAFGGQVRRRGGSRLSRGSKEEFIFALTRCSRFASLSGLAVSRRFHGAGRELRVKCRPVIFPVVRGGTSDLGRNRVRFNAGSHSAALAGPRGASELNFLFMSPSRLRNRPFIPALQRDCRGFGCCSMPRFATRGTRSMVRRSTTVAWS
jgi:hypothetical protein